MKTINKKIFFCFIAFFFMQISFSQDADTLRFARYKDFVNHVTHVFKDNHPELSFFKHRIFPSFSPINIFDSYKGEQNDSIYNDYLSYLSLANCLSIANYNDGGNINHEYLQSQILALNKKTLNDTGFSTGNTPILTPISLSFIEYSEFKDSTMALGYFGASNNQFTENCPRGYYPFKKNRLFASSALNQVFFQSPINFFLTDSFILSNIADKIDSIYIDFSDGNGLTPITKGNIYPISYNSNGTKKIKIKIKSDAAYYYSFSTIIDSTNIGNLSRGSSNNSVTSGCSDDYTPPDEVRSIFAGGIGGHYGIWYSHCNSSHKVRKPFILSGGFNPGNGKQLVAGLSYSDQVITLGGVSITLPVSYGWRGTQYQTSNGVWSKRFSPVEFKQVCAIDNQDRYLDRLRDEGYDVIILMYNDGEQSILDNVKVAKQLIRDIDVEKMNNGFHFENVVSGNSAGAITTRLALAELESEFRDGGPNPHTKLWVSVEGEMQGANVPLGVQYLLDYQADPGHWFPFHLPPYIPGLSIGNVILLDIYLKQAADHANTLLAIIANTFNKNPCANELTNFTTAFPNAGAPERLNLLNTFATVPGNNSNGYPEFCRKVGVSQGSSEGITHPHTSSSPYNSSTIFDADMQFGIPNVQLPVFGNCGGTFTCYFPKIEKRTKASWWNSTNTGEIFRGYVNISDQQTIFPATSLCCNCCGCSGNILWFSAAITIGGNYNIGAETDFKPTVTNIPNASNIANYDDVPSSSLAAQTEFSEIIYNRFYNTFVASLSGLTYCNVDPMIHAFAPTASSLDLRNPNTGGPGNSFVSPVALDLMFNSKTSAGIAQPEPNFRYGFPHLKHPTNHSSFTPYDAVFAIGNNNGTQLDPSFNPNTGQTKPRPNNQFHIEDAQSMMGDYLARVEIAPENLFLSDRNINFNSTNIPGHLQYIAEFEARNNIRVGNGIYPPVTGDFLTPDGDFEVSNGAKAILHSGNDISLLPGTSIDAGSELDAFHQDYACGNDLFRAANNNSNGGDKSNNVTQLPNANTSMPAENVVMAKKKASAIKVYPNPNNGTITIEKDTEEPSKIIVSDITGKLVFENIISTAGANNVNLQSVENGVYLLEVNTGTTFEKFKVMIAK